ncbi:MAG TPA: histidine phosphatase family protein, partial [Acidimicrobiia bacterium]
PVLERLHLIRHGEVHNPDRIVYGTLEGFGLSALGRTQADAAAAHLAGSGAGRVLVSPQQRAVETATPIARRLGLAVEIDGRLAEWGLAPHWEGVPWADLPRRFPGELEAYLATPADLPFAAETIAAAAERMSAVISDLDGEGTQVAIVVSHQDPVQALRFALTGRDLRALGVDRPGHAAVVTLDRWDGRWAESGIWSPPGPLVDVPTQRDRGHDLES